MDDVLDLEYLFKLFKKNIVLMLLVGILGGVVAFAFTNFLVPKKYESRAMLYVENKNQASDSVNINDINAAQKLVNTCQILFKSGTILENLIAELDLPYTKDTLSSMIVTRSVNSTEILEIVVESGDPLESQEIVNALVGLAEAEFKRVIKQGSIEVVDFGEVNTQPSSPNIKLFTLAGFALCFVFVYVVALVRDMFDVTVKTGDDLTQNYKVPVFAEIMDFTSASDTKYGYGYGYGYGKRVKNKNAEEANANSNMSERFISDSTPFAILEAYNTARTNIMFSVAPTNKRIIAVTSSNPSEGKSTTCSNLAISFANSGAKVLLVECDLRKPTMAKNFGVTVKNGLSSVLCGFCSVNQAMVKDVMNNLDIITAGDIPPNPSELLGSEAMKVFINASAEDYDYVFLDTPPVNVVTDSQLMNDLIAGIVFIVRENSTKHPEIGEALEKIKLANGKTLGFVKTFCRTGKSGRYGKKYGYGYGYGYGYKKNAE